MSQLFQDKSYEEEDARLHAEHRRIQTVNLKAFLLTLAIVMAPFLALLFSLEAALVVLAAGLAFTVWLTWMASNTAGHLQKSRLRIVAVMNMVLMAAVLAVLAALLN